MKNKEESKTLKEEEPINSEISNNDLKEIKKIIADEQEFYQKMGLRSITEMETKDI